MASSYKNSVANSHRCKHEFQSFPAAQLVQHSVNSCIVGGLRRLLLKLLSTGTRYYYSTTSYIVSSEKVLCLFSYY